MDCFFLDTAELLHRREIFCPALLCHQVISMKGADYYPDSRDDCEMLALRDFSGGFLVQRGRDYSVIFMALIKPRCTSCTSLFLAW
jgi:hypothetical protein